ncbi:hypothetical protein [Palleronia sp. LCG004]|uniref:hypothetical protein n=1 Tax=Palleronia sp. LCG004 TaxID=3079304 RepID=UPI002942735D|nr:hypothetical protein [Palleronia sp. LCG004]WOI57842.1 hypothetical protein RVY76_14615 [Palleronia sp. LCG004]
MRVAIRAGRALLPMLLVLGLSGCAMFLPTPAKRAFVEVDPAMPNALLMDRVVGVLEENRLLNCSLRNDTPRCAIGWWDGEVERLDREEGILELGQFSKVYTNTVGQSARFRRTSHDTLEITVKGQGAYYGPMPNLAVAKSVARLIEEDLRP